MMMMMMMMSGLALQMLTEPWVDRLLRRMHLEPTWSMTRSMAALLHRTRRAVGRLRPLLFLRALLTYRLRLEMRRQLLPMDLRQAKLLPRPGEELKEVARHRTGARAARRGAAPRVRKTSLAPRAGQQEVVARRPVLQWTRLGAVVCLDHTLKLLGVQTTKVTGAVLSRIGMLAPASLAAASPSALDTVSCTICWVYPGTQTNRRSRRPTVLSP
mmetsp:Transcript_41548/g.134162  ORF Transcript_41548/g.134162 Transcript_41548/m.134162 type:complete len:214 (-) Transcript_41548:1389-2030(-)